MGFSSAITKTKYWFLFPNIVLFLLSTTYSLDKYLLSCWSNSEQGRHSPCITAGYTGDPGFRWSFIHDSHNTIQLCLLRTGSILRFLFTVPKGLPESPGAIPLTSSQKEDPFPYRSNKEPGTESCWSQLIWPGSCANSQPINVTRTMGYIMGLR